MKGRKKGLERKSAPAPRPFVGTAEDRELMDWARCGPDLDASVVSYYLGIGFPRPKKIISEAFGERAARAFETLDTAFFTRVAASLSRVKAYMDGNVYDPRAYIIVSSHLALQGELYRRALADRDPAVLAEEEAMLSRKDYDGFVELRHKCLDETSARKLPTFSEIIKRCEEEPRWPKSGNQKNYTYDLLKKFGLAYHPSPVGRPRKQRVRK